MKYTRVFLSLAICGFFVTLASAQSLKKDVVLSDYGKLPLSFEANNGQTDAHVKFLSRGKGYSLFLTDNQAVIALKKAAPQSPNEKGSFGQGVDEPRKQTASDGAVLRMQLAGANAAPRVVGAEELPGKVNYFIGNDPAKWRTNVPTYAQVKYENIYPGVDLVYYGNQGELEYDFIVAPGADPNNIQLKFRGAGKLRLDGNGDLLLGAAGEAVRFQKPVVYQRVNGERKAVEGSYVLVAANRIGFRLGRYDHTQALVFDPVLSCSTYLGGAASDGGTAIAIDASGNAYVTGYTGSANFPTASPLQATLAGTQNAFVTKFNPSGSALVYSTYLGGSGTDQGNGIAVDASGNAYLTGSTNSTNFPTVNAVQPALAAGAIENAFVSELNSTGSALVYSTYLGGNSDDIGNAIAVDASGSAYVTGSTKSTNFPTASPLQPALGSSTATNAFVTKFNASGSALLYSTYLGGASTDHGNGIGVDSSGNAYITGDTMSSNFPTYHPLQGSLASQSGGSNAFVTELNPTGSAFVYSTYLGGELTDVGKGIAVDASGNAYVTGYTSSRAFPTTAGAYQTSSGGGIRVATNAFVSKLNIGGSALVYSTYLGGANNPFTGGHDEGHGIAVDGSGNAYVTGSSGSEGFPTANALQSTGGGLNTKAFVSVFNGAGSALVYSTYLGGTNTDSGNGIAVDVSGNAYVTGQTTSTDFPTANALQPTYGGSGDAFVAKISLIAGTTTTLTSSLNPASSGQSVTFTATVTSPGAPTPTGTVTFQDGSTVLGPGTLNASAQATFTTSSLALGTHSITAVYGGDNFFTGSTSAALSQDISTLQSITVSPSSGSVPVNQTLQFTATGQYADGSSGNVTTTVTWSSSNTNIATISNAAGTQGLATGVTQGGPVTITALQGSFSATAQLTVTAPSAPAVLSFTPNSGTGTTQTFSAVVTDPAGLADLNNVQVLFNATATRLSGCNVNYNPSQDEMYLYNDDGSAFLPGVVPGSASQASNSQCTLAGTGSSVSRSGNNLTLSVALTFSGTFGGAKNAYVYLQGNNGQNNGGWQQWGTWTVPGTQSPSVVSFTPSSGTGLTQTFTVVVTDPAGLADLNNIQLLFNTTATRLSGCNVNYDAARDIMYLYNDNGSALLRAPASNSQCTLAATGSSVSRSGNNLTLNAALTFSSTFTGQKNAYVYVQGNNGLNNGGWQQWGTWTDPGQPPAVVSFTPSSGAGLTQTFTAVVTDPAGLADLNNVQLLLNTTATRLSGCNVNYDVAQNTMYLYNDDGSGFVGGVIVGSGTQVSNSQCALNGAGTSFSTSGNNLTLNISLTFSGTFTGQKNAYVYVQGNDGLNNGGWAQWGTWTP